MIVFLIFTFVFITVIVILLCAFFDQALLNRRETIFRLPTEEKKIALTFDDGPSPVWTSLILDELKKQNVHATFFMIGHHVQKYPDVAKRVAAEGHTIGNHGYAHSVILYYTPAEIEQEIKYTEHVIKEITGQTTRLYRPPKSWIKKEIKQKIKSFGYDIILWSMNPKDWVGFSEAWMVNFIDKHIGGGDIILFHDSGNIWGTEGGNRHQTVKAVSSLVKKLRARGFQFVSLEDIKRG